jgi:hypothetical protein
LCIDHYVVAHPSCWGMHNPLIWLVGNQKILFVFPDQPADLNDQCVSVVRYGASWPAYGFKVVWTNPGPSLQKPGKVA